MPSVGYLPYSKWQAQVAGAQADWARSQEQQTQQQNAFAAAERDQANEQGAAQLSATVAAFGAPVASLLPRWKAVADQSGLTLADFAKGASDYFSQITNPAGNSEWWGAEAWYRVPLQGASLTHPEFDYSRYTNPNAEQQQQKQLGVQLMAQQAKNGGDSFLGDLGIVAAIAGVVTGGLALAGAFADAAVGATLAETAATAAAAGDAGFIGAAGAAELAGGSSLSLASAAGLAKNAYSVASGVAKLTATPTTSQPFGASTMTNPLYLVNQDTAATSQSAAPQQPGAQTAGATVAAAKAGAAPFGLTSDQIALLAVAAVAAYAFWDHLKG